MHILFELLKNLFFSINIFILKGRVHVWELSLISDFSTNPFKFVLQHLITLQGGRGQWTGDYHGTQSFIVTLYHSMAENFGYFRKSLILFSNYFLSIKEAIALSLLGTYTNLLSNVLSLKIPVILCVCVCVCVCEYLFVYWFRGWISFQ